MGRIEKTVFISYRRTNLPWALAIFQNLKSEGYDVFFDYLSIPSGDFEKIIIENIRARAHFVVILTPSALERCNEPGDWLRREIETAMDKKRNIVPLMLESFDFGSPSTTTALTGKLEKLKKYNGLRLHSEYFFEGMNRLRTQYLNVSLDSVVHSISEIAKPVTEEHQTAASEAKPIGKEELTAQEWFERGYVFALQDNPNESTRCFSESISLKPSYEAYFNRAIIRRTNGDPVGAIQDYSLAIEINPDEAQAYNNRGNARRDIGDLEGALLDYNTSLIKEPRAPRVLVNRGVVQRIRGDFDHARVDFSEAIKANPSPIDHVEALHNLGMTQQSIGDIEDATKHYQNAINVWPFHIMARAYLISIFKKIGKYSEVEKEKKLYKKSFN